MTPPPNLYALRYTAELAGLDIILEKAEAQDGNSPQLIMRFTPTK